MCDSPLTGCGWRTTPIIRGENKQKQSDLVGWTLLLLAATMRSFAHMPLGLFRSQQNGAVTRVWRSCRMKPSQKESTIGAVRCKKEGMLLQPLRWCCVECVIHNERNVGEEQHPLYVARTSNNWVISSSELYCCLLPQCEALRTCRSGFSIATQGFNLPFNYVSIYFFQSVWTKRPPQLLCTSTTRGRFNCSKLYSGL